MDVIKYVKTVDPTINEVFYEYLFARLSTMGYAVGEEDNFNIAYCIDKGVLDLLDYTNRTIVPPQLWLSLVEYIISDYVLLTLTELPAIDKAKSDESESRVSSITEGNTKVDFGHKTSQEQAQEVTEALHRDRQKKCREQWLSYRRMKWA